MKLTKNESILFKETHNKWLNESNFLARLFATKVKSAIQNDKDLKKAVEDADKSVENVRKTIESNLDNDKDQVKKWISPEVRKYLGFDY
jgi:viroplasmin and RNaseH domain-containing protein